MKAFTSLFLAFALALSLTSCQTVRQNLGTVVMTVDGARKVYADAINLGLVTAEQEARIDKLISDYQTAMNVALTQAAYDPENISSAEIAQMANEITAAIIQITYKKPELLKP
jgi:5,10-methylenetetrahydrofolate reductase